MRMLRAFSGLLLCSAVAACGEAEGIAGHIETLDQRIKRQQAEFDATPDVKGAE